MDNYHIELSIVAFTQLKTIGDYITYTLLAPDTSRNFIKGLRNSISQLKFFPYKLPLVQDDILQAQGIRCMPYKNYYIFYEIIENIQVVIVLRIGYNKRNWKDILT